jgi:hypothetical protein
MYLCTTPKVPPITVFITSYSREVYTFRDIKANPPHPPPPFSPKLPKKYKNANKNEDPYTKDFQ